MNQAVVVTDQMRRDLPTCANCGQEPISIPRLGISHACSLDGGHAWKNVPGPQEVRA